MGQGNTRHTAFCRCSPGRCAVRKGGPVQALEHTIMPPPLKRLGLPLLAALLTISPVAAQEPNPNVRFGMPSPAKPDPRQREDYLIARPQYVLSYNAEKRTPNWVSWRLVKGDIGKAARAPFEVDPALPR